MFLKLIFPAAIAAALIVYGPAAAKEGKGLNLVFCCQPQNDLYRVISSSTGQNPPRFDSAAQAIDNAPEGAGVLVLADGYPDQTTPEDASLFDLAPKKRLRLYVEYPSSLPGLAVSGPRRTAWERAVVSSDLFGLSLQKMRILAIHDCHFIPVKAEHPYIVVARVAGFDTAVYGLPAETSPSSLSTLKRLSCCPSEAPVFRRMRCIVQSGKLRTSLSGGHQYRDSEYTSISPSIRSAADSITQGRRQCRGSCLC